MLRLGRALRLAWESGPGWAIASVAILIAQSLLPLVTLYLMKVMVDAVAASAAMADKAAAFKRVLLLIGLSGAVALANALFDVLANLVNDEQAQAASDHMHELLHRKAIEVDLEYYESTEYHDQLRRAQEEAYRPMRIMRGVAQLGQSGILLLGIFGLLASLHWALAAVLVVALIPNVVVRVRHASEMYRWRRQRTAAERQAGYFNYLLTLPEYAKEVRLFELGHLFGSRFRGLRQQIRRERHAMTQKRSVRELAAHSLAILPVFGSYAFIAYQTVAGMITLGGLVMYYQAFQRGQSALQSILNGLVSLYEDHLFLSNLYEFLDLEPKIAEPPNPMPVPGGMRSGIVFEGVSFQYPMSPRKALVDVNLTIRPGEIVALVGENGSGKTTLVKLLCRLYDPNSGTITLDGIDLRRFSPSALRRQISVVFQDYVKYHLTARENIWLGNLDLSPDDERIEAAACRVGADQVITDLKNGYETVLGRYFEQGEELSVGEWQKVALARAFVRDAQLIVLDEPTSALDPQAEAEVFEHFRQLISGRSAVIISHRLSTVRLADYIYILKDGEVIESGTHDELIGRCGTYAHLFEIQAQHYR
jgi:ATP-binding cassette subfamily B protein